MRYVWLVSIILLLALTSAGAVNAEDFTYSGYINGTVTSKSYQLELAAGESVLITAEATSGDLDTYLRLADPSGTVVAENDDRRRGEILDSALGYTATVGGTYTITVSRYEPGDTSGNFVLHIVTGNESVLAGLDSLLTRIDLSGPEQTLDTEHFRIHYTVQGNDAATQDYVDAVSRTLEEVWRIQIERIGWQQPPSDGTRGGDARFDVYLSNLLGDGGTTMGYSSPEDNFGDNPNTPTVEQYATSSYLVIDNDYAEMGSSPLARIGLMRTTIAHEFHHAIQFGYDINDAHNWYYEATSSWMETVTFPKDQDATGYVEYNFEYPELCFGTTNDPQDGLLEYGDWMFMQSLADAHGMDIVPKLWANIGVYEGFDALEKTLERYDDNIPAALARYRIQNLVRDYDLAPQFHATVWLENTINAPGRWTFTGQGIQELGANYYAFALPPGLYEVNLMNDDGTLQLWAVGIRGAEAMEIPLGHGSILSTTGYDRLYLMVFNPNYDEEVNSCVYSSYDIDVKPGVGQAAAPTHTWDARYFEPLH